MTTARTNEISNLEEGFDSANLSERIPVKADKGYRSQKNAELLKKRTRKKHLLKKAWLTNALVKDALGARPFNGIKRRLNGGVAKDRGIKKMHPQNRLEALCYN